ncbi:type I polyketide synthase [Planctomycetes bacterium K23_9]|uniref:Mycocerosic acid synthase n=1 Tax=Stieleria marina TaxID=1930275 RepID=A0A517P205_9BACT|nr:Mycocerosic acid synthase [Planctomycetes bacterium K23_9]
MAFFATDYTIHFDDTMAYGGHHFLTSFKFQCAARESFLFGERIFDVPGVRDALDQVHLLTSDAYARNLHSTQLGDRVAILLTLEEWGRVSARFCYRVFDVQGRRVCAGFQTLIVADAKTGNPMPMPPALREAMDAMREIEEAPSEKSFRDRILSGGGDLDALFADEYRDAAVQFLAQRYPSPQVIGPQVIGLQVVRPQAIASPFETVSSDSVAPAEQNSDRSEAWLFSGQGAFNATLFCQRVNEFRNLTSSAQNELAQCALIAGEILGGDSQALCSGSVELCEQAVNATPTLSQVAIHLQNVLGTRLRQARGFDPSMLIGHSFGEIAAFQTAGCFDLLTGVRIVCFRARAVQKHAPADGGLLVVFAPRHRIETEIEMLGLDQVCVAGRNHEHQTVASGPVNQLAELSEFFKSAGVSTVRVPSPTSFHHPQLQTAAASWLADLRGLDFQPPKRSVYSPIGRRFVTENDDIAAVLAGQLLRPFDFQGAISDAVKAGVANFVDCGSTGSLAGLITKALPAAPQENDHANEQPTSPPQHEVLCLADKETLPGSGSRPKVELDKKSHPLPPHETQEVKSRTAAAARTSDASGQLPRLKRRGVSPVSIVGCGCILPGGASSPDQLFAAITQQQMGIIDQRDFDPHWSEDFYSETLVADRSTSHLSGRVNDADISVPAGVSASVFEKWTRSQQLLSIALSPCVESLGGAQRVVCLIGATADGFEDQDEVSSLLYAGIDPRDPDVDRRMNTARSFGRTPHNAVQEVFDRMVRPGLEVTLLDAACASSLYTVALGMRLLESGQADAVIAGGSFCPGLGNSCLFSQFRGTTSTGCRPFDAGADGVVFSEGAAIVTLRRTEDAERRGLTIHANLRGAGLSSDGRSPSANVPQSSGQILSLQRCYADYGIDPASIHAVEAHGTSTPVGDSTEVETLRRFFVDQLDAPIPIHSLKSTLGHTGWAAGTASIIAAIQYMKRGIFPAQAFHQQPSTAVENATGTLDVPHDPVPLSQTQLRIAVDGFGFGGANAHMVLESPTPVSSPSNSDVGSQTVSENDSEELVFVACQQIAPEIETYQGFRFDRNKRALPKGMLVLPELADDMDISQSLAINLASQVVSQLPNFDDQLRKETSMVLAMSGKSERGIEATTRIRTQRFRRQLSGHDRLLSALDTAYMRARPSRSYTLQCMMPNVAAGRAALLLNINGPNFVVDAGANSLEAAISSATLLLQGGRQAGTNLALVAAVEANSQSRPDGRSSVSDNPDQRTDEYAAAFGMTTKTVAKQQGWKVLSGVTEALAKLNQVADQFDSTTADPAGACNQKAQKLIEILGQQSDTAETKKAPPAATSQASASTDAECQIHAPVWVEKPAKPINWETASNRTDSFVVIVPSDADLVAELIDILPGYCSRGLVVVVGQSSESVIAGFDTSNLVAVDLDNDASRGNALDAISAFQADVITAVQTISSWERSKTLDNVAGDNDLCELLFLVAQRYLERLDDARTELWGLFVGGWNGVVHPRSGSVAGLLKSIHREIPSSRLGTLCTRRGGLAGAMQAFALERGQTELEQETIYDGNTRLVRRLRPTPIRQNSTPQVALNKDSVVVASGGARGVTAVMLESLVRDYQCTVIALGRSPLEAGPDNPDAPSVEQEFYRDYVAQNPGSSVVEMKRRFESTRARWEAHQTMESLRRMGGRVEYHVVDVTAANDVAKVVKQIAARFGKVDLLIHGAGVQFSKRLQDRTLSEFRKTYQVKVAGLNHLVDSCQRQFGKPVATHVLTSAYSVFGNDGQHDYGAANETMDRLCAMNSDGDPARWTSLAWLAWDGIGMTRGSEYRALSKQRSLSGITPEIGQQLFRDVLGGRTGSAINVPVSASEHVKYQLETVPLQLASPNSLSQGVSAGSPRMLERSIELSKVECLEFHRVRNTSTLPGAWVTDSLVGTAMQLYPDSGRIVDVTIEDMTFMRFVRQTGDCDPNLRILVEQMGDSVNAWMICDVLHPTGRVLSKDVVCASARLTFRWEANALRSCEESFQPDVSSSNGSTLVDPYCQGHHSNVDLSGAFDCLKGIQIRDRDRNAIFRPDPKCQWFGSVPALLLDAAWRVGAMYADGDHERLFVPVKIGRMTLPVNADMLFTEMSGWTIRSTAPTLADTQANWGRTEIADESGTLRILVEDASAVELS